MKQNIKKEHIEVEDLDDLSNSVVGLIKAKRFDEAKSVCRKLREQYPEQVDGIERLAMIYEARGENAKAIEYYLKTAEFMRSNPGFNEESIKWVLDRVELLK